MKSYQVYIKELGSDEEKKLEIIEAENIKKAWKMARSSSHYDLIMMEHAYVVSRIKLLGIPNPEFSPSDALTAVIFNVPYDVPRFLVKGKANDSSKG